MIKQYDSYNEFLLHAKSLNCNEEYGSGWDDDDDWYGKVKSYRHGLEMAKDGDNSCVSRAETLLDTIIVPLIGEPLSIWSPTQSGMFPVIPDYLAGSPLSMRAMEPKGDLSPVRIFASTTSAGSVSTDSMLRRGVTLLAFLLKLQTFRPIELFLLSELNGMDADGSTILVIPVESKPLSLAHACFCLCEVGFARGVLYKASAAINNASGQWPRLYGYECSTAYVDWLRKSLDITDSDLYVKAPTYSERIIKDPKAWLEENIRKYNIVEE